MAITIVNPQPASDSSGSGIGFVLGIILLVILAVLLFVYALPYIQQGMNGGIQIEVPKSIDVNLNQPR